MLELLYARFEETEAMTAGLFTDRETVPELDEFFSLTRDAQAAELTDARRRLRADGQPVNLHTCSRGWHSTSGLGDT